jgi:glycosyltransferase involved in cell wall biosynthesis
MRGHLQRWGLGAADGFLFAARELAQPFVQQGTIRSLHDVHQVMEGSSWFAPQDRGAAQTTTGMEGEPIFLWVGRLNQNKDPLTVLAGFELFLARVPGARLYMAYGSEDLLPQVQKRLAGSAALGESVTLLGTVPHADLESCYNSAHYFVLGSHYEGSGYALVEALACGLVPIVTDIPSFQVMTGSGRIGALWPPGDPEALAAAMLDQVRRPWEPSSQAARSFFAEHLSYPTIGCQALGIYRRLAARRAGAVK